MGWFREDEPCSGERKVPKDADLGNKVGTCPDCGQQVQLNWRGAARGHSC